ncbi:MAG: OmpA family protein [Gammaproteobacteria bacterium]|nr:OmpA family protein [Gammaproteobacteria bacterium]
MKNIYVVIAMGAALGLVGCATSKDLSEVKANVNTASEGEFGRCMQAVYVGGERLARAEKLLNKAEEKDGKLSKSDFEKALRASEAAARERRTAEDACEARIVRVEEKAVATAKRVQRTKEVLRGVTFIVGSATLTEEAKATLNVVANRLLRQPTTVEVQGHTSDTGNFDFNMRLSEQRAKSVRSYLISRGVSGDSITVRGFGPTKPIASNDTAEGRRANQRVELLYTQEIQ